MRASYGTESRQDDKPRRMRLFIAVLATPPITAPDLDAVDRHGGEVSAAPNLRAAPVA